MHSLKQVILRTGLQFIHLSALQSFAPQLRHLGWRVYSSG